MNNFESINSINMQSVFDTLGVAYTCTHTHLHIIADGIPTDWRMVYLTGNYVVDFSGKWRASWSPFAFVKTYLRLNDRETFQRFEKHFDITSGEHIQNTHKSKQYKQSNTQPVAYFNNW